MTVILGTVVGALAVLTAGLVWWRIRMKPLSDDALVSIDSVTNWVAGLRGGLAAAEQDLRWVTVDQRSEWEASRPTRPSISAGARKRLGPDQRAALDLLAGDLRSPVGEVNGRILASSLRERKDFFDTIETPAADRRAGDRGASPSTTASR